MEAQETCRLQMVDVEMSVCDEDGQLSCGGAL